VRQRQLSSSNLYSCQTSCAGVGLVSERYRAVVRRWNGRRWPVPRTVRAIAHVRISDRFPLSPQCRCTGRAAGTVARPDSQSSTRPTTILGPVRCGDSTLPHRPLGRRCPASPTSGGEGVGVALDIAERHRLRGCALDDGIVVPRRDDPELDVGRLGRLPRSERSGETGSRNAVREVVVERVRHSVDHTVRSRPERSSARGRRGGCPRRTGFPCWWVSLCQ